MAATNGRSHMRELFQMLDRVTAGAKKWPFAVEKSFSLQNGAGQLREWFAEVAVTRRDDSLEVTEAGAVVAYALSTDRYDLSGGRETWLAELVEDEIARKGRFLITKETGLFVARKQQR